MKLVRHLTTVLALCAAPWIVWMMSTNSLFLTNQADLNYGVRYYLPFCYGFIATVVVGLLLAAVARRAIVLQALLWAYHLGGFAFLVFFSTWRNPTLQDHQTLWVTLLLGMVIALSLTLRRRDSMRGGSILAAFAVLLIVADAFAFVTRYDFAKPDQVAGEDAPVDVLAQPATTGTGLPNIYHLLLDGYQSDLFALTLERDESFRAGLAGFTVFPNNITTSGRTRVSIPQTFAGRTWHNDQSVADFTREAMGSSASVLSALKSSGYATSAYLHQRFRFEPNLFDEVYFHHNASRHRGLGGRPFLALWVYRFLPFVVSVRVLDEETRTEIVHRNLAPTMYAVSSYDTFLRFLEREPELPASSRYTFVHLLLPHDPHVLACDCTYQRAVDPIEQFCCATRVVTMLTQVLKQLGRFENSLIIVHADHGLNLVIGPTGELEPVSFDPTAVAWHEPRAKALLMVKPLGTGESASFVASNAATTLLDVAPTIYDAIGSVPPAGTLGQALTATRAAVGRRHYFYYVGSREDEVFEFVVEADSLRPVHPAP